MQFIVLFTLAFCARSLAATVIYRSYEDLSLEDPAPETLKDALLQNFQLLPDVTEEDLVKVIREFKKIYDLEPIKAPTTEEGKAAMLNAAEDAKLQVPELIRKYGYPAEVHFVTTRDGYILQMHRIPHGKNGAAASKNQSVFLMHGLLSSSADYIITGPDHALAYTLADLGYDVWLGNARGNHYSRNHTRLNPNRARFWHFSWHEIGDIDQPAMIDHVLKTTGEEQTFLVGHSQGTTTFFVMTSMHPQYNKKIKAHIALAPIGFMNHMTSPLLHLASFFIKPLDILAGILGLNEWFPNNVFMELFGEMFCADGELTQILCTNVLFMVSGFSPKEMNATLLPILMGHTPAGISEKQLIHYAQEINSGHFRQYDRGMTGNLLKYHTLFPPDYRLDKVTAPVHLIYSLNDWLAGVEDVAKLCEKIKNCKEMYLITDHSFNHLDYLFGKSAKLYAYQKVIDILKQY